MSEIKLPNRPTKNWLRMAELYRYFARTTVETGFVCDFSERAALQMFLVETYGAGLVKRTLGDDMDIKPDNGFNIGKKWMGVTVENWLESLNGTGRNKVLCAWELYADPNYPHWWLNMVIPERLQEASKATAAEEGERMAQFRL